MREQQGVLLLMEEIPNNHLGCYKFPVNNGINYQPQLVQDFSHQQYGFLQWYLVITETSPIDGATPKLSACWLPPQKKVVKKGDFEGFRAYGV